MRSLVASLCGGIEWDWPGAEERGLTWKVLELTRLLNGERASRRRGLAHSDCKNPSLNQIGPITVFFRFLCASTVEKCDCESCMEGSLSKFND